MNVSHTGAGGGGEISGTPRFIYWALLAVLAIRLITLPVLPLTEPTEGRYATVARDMARSGDLVTPRIWVNDEHIPYLGKPPLHFWLMSVSFALLGENEFAARFPSFLAALAILTMVWWVSARYFDRRIAGSATAILAASGGFFLAAGGVVVDVTFTLWVGGALLLYFGFLFEEQPTVRRRLSLGVFLFLGLAVLTKGPAGLVLFGVPVFLWTLIYKEWRGLRNHAWLLGPLLFLAVAIPWFWAAEIANPGFLEYFLVNENILRYVTPDYGDRYGCGHLRPYGTAIVWLLSDAVPWTVAVLVLLFHRKGRRALKPSDPKVGALLIGFLSMTFFFCFARQLLWAYLLPALPLVAIWIAVVLRRAEVPLARVAAVAVITAVVLGAGQFVIRSHVEAQYSARSVAQRSLVLLEDLGLPGRVWFLHRTPQGAHFYADEKVVPHDKHGWVQLLDSDLRGPGENLYAIHAEDAEPLPPSFLDRLERLEEVGQWILFASRKDARGPHRR